MDNSFKYSTVEALILASPEPLAGKKIAEMLEEMTPSKVAQAVAELNNRYMESDSSYRIREISGGYQFYIVPEYTGYVKEMFSRRRKLRLTRAALETLAIIAYKQPVTKTDIEQIRGVASDGVLQNLLEKNMLTITGRASTVGKPLQYGTTDEFLKFFGLNNIGDLPKMSEIEALVEAADEQNQTEIKFDDQLDDGDGIKLNIADGTYTPEEEQYDDESPVDYDDQDDIDDINEEENTENTTSGLEKTRDGVIIDVDQS